MRKIFGVASVLLLLCQVAFADERKDLNEYDVTDESNYAIFMYDLKNSLIRQFGETDGELRASFILGNLDLVNIKKEMIANMQKEGYNAQNSVLDVEKSERIIQPFIKAIDNFLPTIKGMELSEAFIHLYMQTPEFYGQEWEEDYPKAMLHNAESIAISRFNNKYWSNRISECYSKNASGDDIVDTIVECAQEYKQVVTEETGKVLEQLQAHKYLFDNLYQISPDEKMQQIQSKSGDSYLNVPQR